MATSTDTAKVSEPMAQDESKSRKSERLKNIWSVVDKSESIFSLVSRLLQYQASINKDLLGIVPRLQRHLCTQQQWLADARSSPSAATTNMPGSWIIQITPSNDAGEHKITVVGPGDSEPSVVVAKDQEHLNSLLKGMPQFWIRVCRTLERLNNDSVKLITLAAKLEEEEALLKHPADITVQTHIRRLKEYNDIKDIGQQIIGLVAENRGVPIKELYESGEFGVAADD